MLSRPYSIFLRVESGSLFLKCWADLLNQQLGFLLSTGSDLSSELPDPDIQLIFPYKSCTFKWNVTRKKKYEIQEFVKWVSISVLFQKYWMGSGCSALPFRRRKIKSFQCWTATRLLFKETWVPPVLREQVSSQRALQSLR